MKFEKEIILVANPKAAARRGWIAKVDLENEKLEKILDEMGV